MAGRFCILLGKQGKEAGGHMNQAINIEEFFAQLDGYFQKNELDKVEPFLLSSLEEAKPIG